MGMYYEMGTVGFNYWYVVAPLFMLLMCIIGASRYEFNGDTGRIMKRGDGFSKMMKGIAVLLDALLVIFIVDESLLGLTQWLINHLIESEPAWALFLLPVILLAFAVMYYYILRACGKFGEWAMHGLLIDAVKERRIKRQTGLHNLSEDADVVDWHGREIDIVPTLPVKNPTIIYDEPYHHL